MASGMSLLEPWLQNTYRFCPILTQPPAQTRVDICDVGLEWLLPTVASLVIPLAPPHTEGPTFIGPRLSPPGPGLLGAVSQGQ